MSAVTETPATPLEQLRAEFNAKLAPARLYKRFPKAGLVGCFKVVSKADAREAVETMDDEGLLAKALDRVFIHAPDHADASDRGLVPLGAYVGKPEEDPIGFDHRLCEILAIEPVGPKEVILALFDGNDIQVAARAGELAEWSLDTTAEALQDFPTAG